MWKILHPVLLLVPQIVSDMSGLLDLQDPPGENMSSLNSLSFCMCQNIVEISAQPLFYIVEFDHDPEFANFTQRLHEASIQTISVPRYSEVTSSVTYHGKNMLFILNDPDELFDLVFYTSSQQETLKPSREMGIISGRHRRDVNDSFKETLPRYCIKVDENFVGSREEATCSEVVKLASIELETDSILTDEVFNVTQGLYLNKILNSKNYLVFVLKNFGRNRRVLTPKNENQENFETDFSLIFCFRFFWRFFKGQRAVICLRNGCKRYDPFEDELISYSGATDKLFFDFSWNNMNGKPLTTLIDSMRVVEPEETFHYFWSDWVTLFFGLMEHFCKTVNCTPTHPSAQILNKWYRKDFQVEEGLQFGIDVHLFDPIFTRPKPKYYTYDISASLDTISTCIATPHSDFMSQGLVLFKSFTPTVWSLIFITFISFCSIHHAFKKFQSELFVSLYTESEIEYFRDTSSILVAYAFFLCVSPPHRTSLHLGRLISGKLLLSLFSFSSIVISTVFLNGMTTLLSNRVVYPEIDSLRALEESDIFIQTFNDAESVKLVFDHQNLSRALKERLIGSLSFYTVVIGCEVQMNYVGNTSLAYQEVIRKVEENVRSITTTDAYLVSVPFSNTARENLRLKHPWLEEWTDYHMIRECLWTYPFFFSFPKNSFYFDRINGIIAQYVEFGLVRKILMDASDDMVFDDTPRLTQGAEPRAFSLNDLQSAFIGLLFGLFLSFLAFVGEVIVNLFEFSGTVKFLKGLKNWKP